MDGHNTWYLWQKRASAIVEVLGRSKHSGLVERKSSIGRARSKLAKKAIYVVSKRMAPPTYTKRRNFPPFFTPSNDSSWSNMRRVSL